MLGNAKIPFEYSKVKLKVGQKTVLNAVGFPANTYPSPAWTVGDPLVASLGVMTGSQIEVLAVAVGSTYVTANIQGTQSRVLVEVFNDAPEFVIVTTSKPQ